MIKRQTMAMKALDNAEKVPFSNSYWVVPGQFLAGYYPGDRSAIVMDRKLESLLNCGIRHVINLMEDKELDMYSELFIPYQPRIAWLGAERGIRVSCERMSVKDLGIPSRQTMKAILDSIDAALNGRLPVYVHCLGGVGRTGTVVGCWLARHGYAEGEGVLDRIIELRCNDAKAHRLSPETKAQQKMVCTWKKGE